MHFKFEGDILKKESEEANDQETFWDDKKQAQQKMLNEMNAQIVEDDVGDPHEGNELIQKKSLRNEFNFQERSV